MALGDFVTMMKPIIYYEIINRGFGADASWTNGPSYHRPFIEFTTIKWDSDDTEFDYTGDDPQYYVRLQASPDYNLGPSMIDMSTDAASIGDSTANGFAPVYVRIDDDSSAFMSGYYEYPGNYSPQDNHSGILEETM